MTKRKGYYALLGVVMLIKSGGLLVNIDTPHSN